MAQYQRCRGIAGVLHTTSGRRFGSREQVSSAFRVGRRHIDGRQERVNRWTRGEGRRLQMTSRLTADASTSTARRTTAAAVRAQYAASRQTNLTMDVRSGLGFASPGHPLLVWKHGRIAGGWPS